MCGITGYLNWDGIRNNDEIIISKMTHTLLKRGPDGTGTWLGDYVAFGHTRLSIIDLTGGSQPMTLNRKQGSLTITLNGEIYNYKELRQELSTIGHHFKTYSDTEVVLHAYDEWGENCVIRFVGMFSFAIWDDFNGSLFLARDPLGVKPLYYFETSSGLIFGSEEKAILAHHEVQAQLDSTGIAELFCMMPMTNPHGSIFKGIQQLRPGHTLTATRSHIKIRCYWKLEAIEHTDDKKTTIEKIATLFKDAVQTQMIADVPLGAMLSGGVDSSAVAALAAQFAKANHKEFPTFAIDYIGYGDTSYLSSEFHQGRDTPWAEKVANHIHSSHTTHYVSVDELTASHEANLTAWGRPSISPLNNSLYLLFKYIRSTGVKTVLGGEGADEAFAGYRWWNVMAGIRQKNFPWHSAYRSPQYLLNNDFLTQINPERYLQDSYDWALNQVPKLPGENSSDRQAREISWLTYTYYLNWLLHRVDRTSMAAGIEARVPFCDHRLVQYAWNIPYNLKTLKGVEKGILRQAVEINLPYDVAWRRKSGYPTAQMESYQNVTWKLMSDLVKDSRQPVWVLANRKVVENIISTEQKLNINDWTILNHICYLHEMNTWLKQWKISII